MYNKNMGMHFSEIEPIGQLDKSQTQNLARGLSDAASKNVGLSPELIQSIIKKYNLSVDNLKSAGWFQDQDISAKRGIPLGRYGLSDLTLAIAAAPTAPRMSFEEACSQIKSVRSRLDAAPAEIEGISINALYLAGSTLRDKNARDTIGDLDLNADFGFDRRYDGVPHDERVEIAKQV
jgi:hypothetical protein